MSEVGDTDTVKCPNQQELMAAVQKSLDTSVYGGSPVSDETLHRISLSQLSHTPSPRPNPSSARGITFQVVGAYRLGGNSA